MSVKKALIAMAVMLSSVAAPVLAEEVLPGLDSSNGNWLIEMNRGERFLFTPNATYTAIGKDAPGEGWKLVAMDVGTFSDDKYDLGQINYISRIKPDPRSICQGFDVKLMSGEMKKVTCPQNAHTLFWVKDKKWQAVKRVTGKAVMLKSGKIINDYSFNFITEPSRNVNALSQVAALKFMRGDELAAMQNELAVKGEMIVKEEAERAAEKEKTIQASIAASNAANAEIRRKMSAIKPGDKLYCKQNTFGYQDTYEDATSVTCDPIGADFYVGGLRKDGWVIVNVAPAGSVEAALVGRRTVHLITFQKM